MTSNTTTDSSDWTNATVPNDTIDSKMPLRKQKRTVPDNQKDDKYWEKRQRNNLAAKRSRANKRRSETDVRLRVVYLEQENAFMKKEISFLREKLNLDSDQSILSDEDRFGCMQEISKRQKEMEFQIENGQEYTNASNTSSLENVSPKHEEFAYNCEERRREEDNEKGIDLKPWHNKNDVIVASEQDNSDSSVHHSSDDEKDESLETLSFSSATTRPSIVAPSPFPFYIPFGKPNQSFYPWSVHQNNRGMNNLLGMNKTGILMAEQEFQNHEQYQIKHRNEQATSSIHGDNFSTVKQENTHLKRKLMQLSAEVDEMKSMLMKS